MKKALLFATIATSVITLSVISCTKKTSDATANYTCHCVIVSGAATDTSNIPENNLSSSSATTACNNYKTALTTGNPGSTVTCALQ